MQDVPSTETIEQKNLFLHVFIFLSELYDSDYVQDFITFLSMIINFNFLEKNNTHMLPFAVELHNVVSYHNHPQHLSRKK